MTPDVEIPDVADRLLAKLRKFVQELDRDERAVLAALLAPGIAASFPTGHQPPEVEAFGFVEWDERALHDAMARSVVQIPPADPIKPRAP
jgi:hypothetical protein